MNSRRRESQGASAPQRDQGGSFDTFVIEHRSDLVGALRIRTGDRMVAEEIAQEAFAKTWLAWSRVSAMSNPGAWLYRVAFNLATSQWRRRFAFKRAMHRIETKPTGPEPLPSEAAQALQDAISELTHRQREVVILRYFVGMSVQETAETLGMRSGTVKSHTSRALEKLRSVLDESTGEPA